MSSGDALSDSITRAIVDGDDTLQPPRAEAGLSMVAQRLFRQPLDPIRLSRYIVLEPLGQGAFGAVYAAYDPELNRKVAIKLLVPRGSRTDQDAGRERLLREAQAMAHFSHPNVVAVYDVGTYSLDPSIREEVREVVREGVFLVMELVDGHRLDHWARARDRSWREIVIPMIEAAKGLAAAHDAGLVHRDFKPANVLVDQRDRPRILDFGLARLHGDGPSSSSGELSQGDAPLDSVEVAGRLADSLTRTGTVLGTPRYMGPEQHHGDEAQAWSDQYAFCTTLFELLYGGPPFSARRIEDLVRAKLAVDDLRPPSGNVPPWLFRVIQRGLDPDPRRRFADMHALITALQHDPARGRRRVGWVLSLGAVAMGTGWAATSLGDQPSPCSDHVTELAGVWEPAVAERVEAAFLATSVPHAEPSWRMVSASLDEWAEQWATERIALCEATRGPKAPSADEHGKRLLCLERHRRRTAGLTHVLAEADAEVVEAAGLMARELELPSACARLASPSAPVGSGAGSGSVHADEAEDAVAQAHALITVRKLQAAVEAARRAVETTESFEDDHLRARARLVLADALLGNEDARQARDEAQTAIELAERAGDDELACEGLVLLFRALIEAGDHAGADLVARLASSRAEATVVGDRVAALLAYHTGAMRLRQGRYADARPHLLRARSLRERLHGAGHPLVAEADNALAVSLHRDGHRDEALEVFERAIASLQASLGPKHPQLAKVHNNFGNYWLVAGRYDEAYRELTLAAEINTANFTADHPSVATAQYNLALVAQAQGARRKALVHLEVSGRVRLRHLGADHPEMLRVRSLQASLLGDLGQEAEAVVILREVLQAETRTLGPDHPDAMETAMHLAIALGEGGQTDEGAALAEDVVARAERTMPGSDQLGRWLVTMARIDRTRGRVEEAEREVGRALELLRYDSGESSPLLSQAHLVRSDVALDRGDPVLAETSATSALTMMTTLFGADHGRQVSPLLQRAAARAARGDRAGAQADLERAAELVEGYEGPPLLRAQTLFALAKVLPPEDGGRAKTVLRELRAELRRVRDQAPAELQANVDALERELVAWVDAG